MLGRAVLPLLRPRALPSPIRLSLAVQQSRQYGRNKPRVPSEGYKIPDSARTANRYPIPTRPFQRQDFDAESRVDPEVQPEFETRSESDANTAPEPTATFAQGTRNRSNEIPDTGPLPDLTQGIPSTLDAELAETAARRQNRSREETQQSKPLPDLTQGIPSTLDAELAEAAAKRAQADSLNVTEAPETPQDETSTGGRGRGEPPKSEYISSIDRRRNFVAQITMGMLAAIVVTGVVYSGRNWETEEEERKHPDAPSGWGFGLFYNRVRARITDVSDYYNEPAFPKLLPEEDPQYKAPFTLVLSLEDLLVHSEWDREHGWRLAKRPGVDYFLRYLSQYYELVLFTSTPSMMADPVLRKLDPYRIIRWPLFREATRYKNGEYIKDLDYLNRDISKIIMIDTVPAHASQQPENAIILPKWKGDPNDKILVAFIPFLEYIATMGFDDVRTVIKSFEGTYIPLEFAKREKILREKFEKQIAEERKKRPKRSIGSLASIFGIRQPAPVMEGMETSTLEGLEQGKMLWDQIRERGQKQFEAIDKEIRENGDKWLAEMAAEEEKMKEEQMKGMKSSMAGWFGNGGGGGK